MSYVRLTQKVIDRIVDSMRKGCSNKTVIAHAGCSESTFYLWISRGRDDQAKGITTIHAQLVENMDEADAERERSLVQDIIQDKSWESKAWLLEGCIRIVGVQLKSVILLCDKRNMIHQPSTCLC